MADERILKECEETLRKLVMVDTSQPEGNEFDIVKVIDSLLPECMYREIIDHGNNRASLVARADGQNEKGGLAFVGHIDTVSFGDIDRWTHHPLSAHTEDDILHGRGSSDMKGGVAAMIITARRIMSHSQKPKHNIYFCFTADEEANGTGVLAMLENGVFEDVDEFIIAEPTSESIGVCEKGALWLKITAFGALAHGSRPDVGINAIDLLFDFFTAFKDRVISNEIHELLNKTTVVMTKINGGILTNIIPDNAQIEIDIRTLPSLSHDEIIETAKDIFNSISKQDTRIHFELEVLNNRLPAQTPANSAIVERMSELFVERGMDCAPKGFYFYTDMSQIISYYNRPFVILGPGDDKQAHQLNEHISISSIANFADIFTDYIEKFYLED